MALDVYCWLAHRLCRVDHAAGIVLSWGVLKEQFGQEFTDLRDFRRSFLEAIQKALVVYREARLEVVRGGLKLMPSPAPIKKTNVTAPKIVVARGTIAPEKQSDRRTKRVLPLAADTIRTVEVLCKGWSAVELWERSPFASRVSTANIDDRFKKWAWEFYLSDGPQVSAATEVVESSTITLRPGTLEAARALANGQDIEQLLERFRQWTSGEGRAPRNPDAAFLGWLPKFLEGGRKQRKRQV
jgi:hypothetical protein